MKIYYDFTPSVCQSAVALGNFDGLHIGHQKVIAQAVQGEKRGLMPTVLTFDDNLIKNLDGSPCERIITSEYKSHLLEQLGVRQLYILPFLSVKDMTAEEFVKSVLIDVCKAKEACCGFNFTFGRGGTAGSRVLADLCAARGLSTAVADAVLAGGTPVSSTRIRGLISAGRAEDAAKLLGRPFCFISPVLRGRRIGHTLGTPTVNQAVPDDFIKPKYGVYVSKVYLKNGKTYCGVTNVGVKPTVGSNTVLVETWMPDYHGPEIYGETIRTDLMKFLRPERKFSGLEELKSQILLNAEQAKEFFKNSKNPL